MKTSEPLNPDAQLIRALVGWTTDGFVSRSYNRELVKKGPNCVALQDAFAADKEVQILAVVNPSVRDSPEALCRIEVSRTGQRTAKAYRIIVQEV